LDFCLGLAPQRLSDLFYSAGLFPNLMPGLVGMFEYFAGDGFNTRFARLPAYTTTTFRAGWRNGRVLRCLPDCTGMRTGLARLRCIFERRVGEPETL